MSEVKDGGSVFPQMRRVADVSVTEGGITLRDHFASKCDVSLYTPYENLKSQMGRNPNIGEMAEYIAAIRYAEADAMLAARDTGTTER